MSNFDVYTGASGTNVRDEGGLGPSVVKWQIEPFKGIVFYNSFFSSVDLAKYLLLVDTYACGTERMNRQRFPDSLKKSSLKRGESKSELVEDCTVHYFVWQDKKAVSFINTIFDECQVKRKNKDCLNLLSHVHVQSRSITIRWGVLIWQMLSVKLILAVNVLRHQLFLNICIVNVHVIQSESPHQTNLMQKEF